MGWDVTIVNLKPGVAPPVLPRPAEEHDGADDLTLFDRAEIEQVLRSLPGVVGNGPDFYSFEDVAEVSPSELGVFVGHAKLEALLALRTHLEGWRPGWLFLNHADGSLHDADSLRRWLEERAAIAAKLRAKPRQ